jgi:hypothetical protein
VKIIRVDRKKMSMLLSLLEVEMSGNEPLVLVMSPEPAEAMGSLDVQNPKVLVLGSTNRGLMLSRALELDVMGELFFEAPDVRLELEHIFHIQKTDFPEIKFEVPSTKEHEPLPKPPRKLSKLKAGKVYHPPMMKHR